MSVFNAVKTFFNFQRKIILLAIIIIAFIPFKWIDLGLGGIINGFIWIINGAIYIGESILVMVVNGIFGIINWPIEWVNNLIETIYLAVPGLPDNNIPQLPTLPTNLTFLSFLDYQSIDIFPSTITIGLNIYQLNSFADLIFRILFNKQIQFVL